MVNTIKGVKEKPEIFGYTSTAVMNENHMVSGCMLCNVLQGSAA